MLLTATDLQTTDELIARTHGATGVTVHFRRLPHLERTTLLFPCIDPRSGRFDIGAVIQRLAQPGAGVAKWAGVQQPHPGNPDLPPIDAPYSVAALNAAAKSAGDTGRAAAKGAVAKSGLAPDSEEGRKLREDVLRQWDFGQWFNQQLLEIAGITGDGLDAEEVDAEGNADVPAST